MAAPVAWQVAVELAARVALEWVALEWVALAWVAPAGVGVATVVRRLIRRRRMAVAAAAFRARTTARIHYHWRYGASRVFLGFGAQGVEGDLKAQMFKIRANFAGCSWPSSTMLHKK